MRTDSLPDWLDYIASVHPREIELGLDRVRAVASRMGLSRPAPLVVTVAGTNGKGSCVATLEAVLEAAGYRTGLYTSPHIHAFNERIRVRASAVDDAALCSAFAAIEACRPPTSLSYFEFATLAALYLFEQAGLDVALLEVGLGGRLDAVNLIDADVAVITSISLDHQDWLGDDLEGIAGEKAGILRAGRPAIYGSLNTPRSIAARAAALPAPLLQLGEEFAVSSVTDSQWEWRGQDRTGAPLVLSGLPRPNLILSNVAAALQALHLLPLSISPAQIRAALDGLILAGRFEARRDQATGRAIIFDVAHNPAGAAMLAANLRALRQRRPDIGRVVAVLAVMADKDVEGMVSALESCVDFWYIAQVDEPRCLRADTAVNRLAAAGFRLQSARFDSVQAAYVSACEQGGDDDLVVVCGSFHTVAAVRALSRAP